MEGLHQIQNLLCSLIFDIYLVMKAFIYSFQCVLLFCSLHCFSQEKISLYGKVTDSQTQEGLIGATIVIEGTDIATSTDVEGRFELKNISVGTYNISARFFGYQSNTKSNVVVRSKGNDDLSFQLTEDIQELEAITIKASPFQTKTATPLSIQTLSAEEIKTYPGGNNDIAKVVQSLPGVAGSAGGFRNDVIIRGGAPNENVYYLDGIEIPNINHFSTQGSAGGPVGMLNVDFIEEVDLTASAFEAKYDNPLSGVLQFYQREGNPRKRQTTFRVGASETAITTEGPLFKKEKTEANTTYILSARRSYLQFLFQAIGLPILPDYWDYQYKIQHRLNDRNTLYLTGIGAIDDFRVNPPEQYDAAQQAVLEQVPIIKQWSTTAGIGWKRKLKDGKGNMNTTASVNMLDNNFTRYQDNVNKAGVLFQNKSRESELRLRYAYTRFVNNWTINTGLHITNANYFNDTRNEVENNSYTTDISFYRYGLFAQASRSFGRFGISGGFRLDDNSYTSEKYTLLKTFSPRLSFNYYIDKANQWKLSASLGKYYKIAPYTVLGYQDTLRRFSNKDVSYIGSLHAVAGIEKKLGKYAKLSIEGFYKKYSNYPISITDAVSLANKGGDFSVLGNEDVTDDGKGRTYGVEVLFQQKFNKNIYGLLAYTLFKSEFTNANGHYLPSIWDSRHILSFTGGYKMKRNWEISVRNRFAGKSPYVGTDLEQSLASYPVFIADYNDLGKDRLGIFNQLDIRIDKKWNFNSFALNAYLEIQNILAQTAPEAPSYGLDRDDDGNVVSPQSLVVIEASSGRPIPTIGIVVDF